MIPLHGNYTCTKYSTKHFEHRHIFVQTTQIIFISGRLLPNVVWMWLHALQILLKLTFARPFVNRVGKYCHVDKASSGMPPTQTPDCKVTKDSYPFAAWLLSHHLKKKPWFPQL